MQTLYPVVEIREDKAKLILQGHPWIFSGAIKKMPKLSTGDLCEVRVAGKFIGIGYYNSETNIAIRLLSREPTEIDRTFFEKKIRALKNQKEPWLAHTDAYRVVFGESDGVPGLIVDKYVDVLVVQYHTAGIDRFNESIVSALQSVLSPKCIYLKQSLHSERIEGKAVQGGRVLFGQLPEELIITEHGFRFYVDVVRGQKTGFFLDQRENRKAIMPYVSGRSLLNCFAYTGGFSVYAAAGAKRVATLDISKGAIEDAKRNFALNALKVNDENFVVADVFDYLKTVPPGEFDAILLDPPSFARRRTQVTQAIKAYITINSKALEKLPPGGILISSSCTAHIDELTFIKILYQCAVNTRCQLKVLHSATQPIDHPYNLHFPEGRYLKFFVLLKEVR